MVATEIIFQVHETTGQSNLMVFNQSIAHCCFYNGSQMFYFYRLNFGRFLLHFALESTQQKMADPVYLPASAGCITNLKEKRNHTYTLQEFFHSRLKSVTSSLCNTTSRQRVERPFRVDITAHAALWGTGIIR